MSKGHQELNLVYISDVIEAYKAALNLIETQPTGEIRTFGVRSNYSIPLKDLASLYEELKGVELNIAWGAKPYRKREVMYPPTILPTLPGWTPKIDLKQGLSLV
jgi:nucleoside-diphosphate-sugar epimerase